MGAVRSSETSVGFYRTIQRCIPEERTLLSYRCGSLKSNKLRLCFILCRISFLFRDSLASLMILFSPAWSTQVALSFWYSAYVQAISGGHCPVCGRTWQLLDTTSECFWNWVRGPASVPVSVRGEVKTETNSKVLSSGISYRVVW
jgi:hypothetical protein